MLVLLNPVGPHPNDVGCEHASALESRGLELVERLGDPVPELTLACVQLFLGFRGRRVGGCLNFRRVPLAVRCLPPTGTLRSVAHHFSIPPTEIAPPSRGEPRGLFGNGRNEACRPTVCSKVACAR